MFGMNDASEFAFLVVLLPLLPAILIFLMFPKTEMVAQGPLQGLSIRAGGAFGAYLIVLLVLMTWMATIGMRTIPRTWTVEANVVVKDKMGRVINPRALNKNAFSVSYTPTYIHVVPRQNNVKIAVTATEVGGDVPAMTIAYGDGNVTLDPDDKAVKWVRYNWKNKYVLSTPSTIDPVKEEAFANITVDP